MLRPILRVFAVLSALSSGALASQFPTEHDPKSNIGLDFSDLDFVLKSSVLDMGPSTHKRAHRLQQSNGSRLVMGNHKATRREGNRVAFHLFEEVHHRVLRSIRDDLLNLPDQIDFEDLSRNNQLAYWLNLHNAIVLAELAEAYPFTNVRPMFDRAMPSAFINRADYKVAGLRASLADIQDHVLTNWRDPLVIYGFYMGAVGTPNIRQEAYLGDRVYEQLRGNARNFVNSVRGTQIWNGSKLRVASYYERMAVKFPNFDRDVMRHIRRYARPKFATRLIAINRISPEIDDWNIADLYNGHLHRAGGSKPIVVRDFQSIIPRNFNIPPQVMQVLEARRHNFRNFDGEVTIEELSSGSSEPDKKPKSAEESEADSSGELLIQ